MPALCEAAVVNLLRCLPVETYSGACVDDACRAGEGRIVTSRVVQVGLEQLDAAAKLGVIEGKKMRYLSIVRGIPDAGAHSVALPNAVFYDP